MRERIVRPDGSVRALLTTGEVVTGADGRPTRMRGICWDVTDREAVLESAQRSVAQVTEVSEASPVPCLIVDEAGVVLHVNGPAVDRLGWTPSTTISRSVTAILQGSGLPETVGVPVTATVRTRAASLVAEVRSVAIDAGERRLIIVFVDDDVAAQGSPVLKVPAQSAAPIPGRAGA
jgi:PAS domain-containing protein